MFKAAGHILVRLVLAYLFGDSLGKRVELNSSIHSLISLKEASFWSSIGRSPYTGSTFRGPPLLLLLFEQASAFPLLQTAILSASDWIGSRLLQEISAGLLQSHHSTDSQELINTAALLHLLNPCLVLSASAASTASFVNLILISALHGAVRGNAVVAGLGIAGAVYLSPYNLILLVPITLLLCHDDQHVVANTVHLTAPPPSRGKWNTSTLQTSVRQKLHKAAQPILLYFCFFMACLLLLSDIQLRRYPEHWQTSFLRFLFPCPSLKFDRPVGTPAPVHWTRHVYGYMMWAPDTSPNIGMWWYFFAEVFPSWRAPFKLVFIAAWLVSPLLLAKRLYKDPLLLFTCYCIIISLLKPHPTAADAAMFMALLPFFPHLLSRLPSSVFTATSLLILGSLSPAMWYLWMDLEAANANFFYAITLLWAAWQVMLLLQLVTAALEHSSEFNEKQQCPSVMTMADLPSQAATGLADVLKN